MLKAALILLFVTQKYASVGFLALSLLFWLLIFLYSFVLADCAGTSEFQKGFSETESCVSESRRQK